MRRTLSKGPISNLIQTLMGLSGHTGLAPEELQVNLILDYMYIQYIQSYTLRKFTTTLHNGPSTVNREEKNREDDARNGTSKHG